MQPNAISPNEFISRETISPDIAAEWLRRNRRPGDKPNRLLHPEKIVEYAKAMTDGRWRLNGETIKLGPAGELLDGQHRLFACCKAGVSFESFVVRRVDPEAFDTIDVGLKRSAADILSIEGCKSASAVAGAIRWIIAIEGGKFIRQKNARIPADETRSRWMRDLNDIEKSLPASCSCKSVLQPSIGLAMHYLFAKRDKDRADYFFESLGKGAFLREDDPVFLLRERLLRGRLAKAKFPSYEIVCMVIRAWNAFREDRPLRSVRGTIMGDDGTLTFPEIR